MKSTIRTTLLFVLLTLLLTNSVFALGISPSRKIVDFTADMQQEITFTILNDNKDLNVIIYPRGELAQYILIEKSSMHISSSQKEVNVRYKINVPYSARKPGMNLVEIVVEETASNYDQQTAVGGKLAVVHQLMLNSPFIGTYARTIFSANNPEFGNELQLVYSLFNEGSNDISGFTAEAEVFNSNLESIGTQQYSFGPLNVGEARKETVTFSKELSPGNYLVKTRIYYEGKVINAETNFVVGGSYIAIEGIGSSDFRLGNINKIDVSLYNRIPEEIKNVFAEIIVKDKQDKVYSIFKTISIDMQPLSGNTLFGYWDTSNIAMGVYNMLVKANYDGKLTEKEFEVKVLQNEIISSQAISGSAVVGKAKPKDPMISILIVSFIVLMIINVLLVIYIRKGKNPPPAQLSGFVILLNLFLISTIVKIKFF